MRPSAAVDSTPGVPIRASAEVPGSAGGAVPRGDQPAVPDGTVRGLRRGADHHLHSGAKDDQRAEVPDGAEEAVPLCATAGVQLKACGEVHRGADHSLQSGTEGAVCQDPSAAVQACANPPVRAGAQARVWIWQVTCLQLVSFPNSLSRLSLENLASFYSAPFAAGAHLQLLPKIFIASCSEVFKYISNIPSRGEILPTQSVQLKAVLQLLG